MVGEQLISCKTNCVANLALDIQTGFQKHPQLKGFDTELVIEIQKSPVNADYQRGLSGKLASWCHF